MDSKSHWRCFSSASRKISNIDMVQRSLELVELVWPKQSEEAANSYLSGTAGIEGRQAAM